MLKTTQNSENANRSTAVSVPIARVSLPLLCSCCVGCRYDNTINNSACADRASKCAARWFCTDTVQYVTALEDMSQHSQMGSPCSFDSIASMFSFHNYT